MQDEVWKLLNLLFVHGKRTQAELDRAGAGCEHRVIERLKHWGAIQVDDKSGQYRLSDTVTELMGSFLLVPRHADGVHMCVDHPRAFIAMPYREDFSNAVYGQLIEPSVRNAQLDCDRADERARVGSLEHGLWSGILAAGLIVAEVSKPNVNVCYEIGLAHALGKPVLILKQKGTDVLPADLGGKLYCEYDVNQPEESRPELTRQLKEWATSVRAFGVQALGASRG